MQSLSTALVSRGKGHDTYTCLRTHKHMGVASPLCPSHSHWVHRGPHPIRDSRVLPRGCVMAGLLQPGIVVALTSSVTSHAEVNGWWALPLGSAFHRAGICLPLQHHLPSHTARGLMISAPPARLLSSALHLFQALLSTVARGFPVRLSIWACHRVLGKLPRPPITCGTKPKSLVSPARPSSPAPAFTESFLFCHLLPASQTCPPHSPNAATLFPPRGHFCPLYLLSSPSFTAKHTSPLSVFWSTKYMSTSGPLLWLSLLHGRMFPGEPCESQSLRTWRGHAGSFTLFGRGRA